MTLDSPGSAEVDAIRPTVALRAAAVILALLLPLTSLAAQASSNSDGEVRALWVTRNAITSPAAVAQMVRVAHESGFNTLIVQVRGRADAYYQSSFEPRAAELAARPDFDPLAETLALARKTGLRVHAWVAVNLISSAFEMPASRQHLVYRQPDWLMVPRDLATELLARDPRNPEYLGNIARWTRARSTDVEGLYMSAAHPSAINHLSNVVRELTERYAVDGIHLDYARYPSDAFDYSRITLAQFKQSLAKSLTEEQRLAAEARERIDPLAYPNLHPERWRAFHRSRVTSLVMRLRTIVKTARPEAAVSAAVVPDVAQAYDVRYQDWRTWLDQSLVDVLVPMAYARELPTFEKQIATARDLAGDRPVWAGIGAYRLSPEETLQHIAAARRLRARGVALFSYDALVSPPNSAASLADLGKAAFQPTPQ